MGFIRGFFLVIVAVILFVSFLSVNLLWNVSSSLEYENVQREVPQVVMSLLDDINATQMIEKNYDMINLYCAVNPEEEYVFMEEGYTFTISCSSALQGEDAIIEDGIKSLITSVYYKDYDCSFWKCLEEEQAPLFVISQHSYNYWNSKFYFSLIVSLILLILVFILVEKKTNMPILAGILLIVSALPFIKLNSLLNLLSDKTWIKVLNIFFSQSYPISIKILIMGIILLVIGIILKFFKAGFFISNIISKFRKDDRQKQSTPQKKKNPTKMQLSKKDVKKGKRK